MRVLTQVAPALLIAFSAAAATSANVYVGNPDSDIFDFSVPAYAREATLLGGYGSTKLAISADGSTLYAAGLNEVTVVSRATGKVVSTIHPAYTFQFIIFAVSPDNSRVYLGTFDGSENYIEIYTPSGAEVAIIPFGSELVEGIAFAPDAKTAYVSHFDPSEDTGHRPPNSIPSQALTAIDVATSTLGASVPFAFLPSGVVISADGSDAYVSIFSYVGDTGLAKVDLNTLKVVRAASVDTGGFLALSPNGATIYTCNLDGTVYFIDTQTLKTTSTVVLSSSSTALIPSPNGQTLYAIGSNVDTIDVATLTVNSLPSVGNALSIAISPNGEQLYALASEAAIEVLDGGVIAPAGGISVQGPIASLAVSPEGKEIYSADGFNGVWVSAIATGQSQNRFPQLQNYTSILVSRDGTTLYALGYQLLAFVNISSGVIEQQIAIEEFSFGQLILSPDGKYLYVPSQSGTDIVDTASRAIIGSIPNTSGVVLALTPSGNAAYTGGMFNAFSVLDLSTHLVTGTIPINAPSIVASPDGTKVYFASANVLYAVDASTLAIIQTLSGVFSNLAITPDGSRIYAGIYGYWALSPEQGAVIDTSTMTVLGVFPSNGVLTVH